MEVEKFMSYGTKMKHLLILRCGKKSIHTSWLYANRNLIDIAFVYYDDADFSNHNPQYVDRIEGTKHMGLHYFLKKNPEIIEKYDYFWMFEDDLFIPYETMSEIISFINKYKPHLSAPSLTKNSFFSHPITLQNKALYLRGTDFVECMSPVMSREFLVKTLDQFLEFPVWGIEWYWQHLLWEMREVAIIYDKWPIYHTRPVGGGALYKIAEDLSINPMDDLHKARNIYSNQFNGSMNIFFGIQDFFDAPFLVGSDLKKEIASLSSYNSINTLNYVLDSVKFNNEMFSQFLSFPIVNRILKTPEISGIESDFIVRDWSFGGVTSDECWCDNIKFDFFGQIRNYYHPNERFWKIINGNFAFISEDGCATTIFDKKELINGKIFLTGACGGNTNNILYLKEK